MLLSCRRNLLNVNITLLTIFNHVLLALKYLMTLLYSGSRGGSVFSYVWKCSMGLIGLHSTDQILTVHFSRDFFLGELNDVIVDVDKVYLMMI